MIKLRRMVSIGLFSGLALLLGGCERITILNPKGSIAVDEKDLLITCLLLMLIVVIPTIILAVVIAIKYRASNKKARYTPNWGHSYLLEAICWGIPIIIIAILATITWISSHRLDPYRPLDVKGKPITIQVIALDWRWLFIYPEQHIATLNFVEFPVNTQIQFLITSDAPMNSFHIPQLGSQIYAMAGMRTQLHILANEVGDYRGDSTNYSGDGFANMNFVAHVVSQQDFNQWVASTQKSPHVLNQTTYNTLVPASKDHSVQYYSHADAHIFDNTMMKYMMPMPQTEGK